MINDPYKYFETGGNGNSVPDRLASGILHLYEGWRCAIGFDLDLWQFASSLRSLRQLGVTDNDCRWLFCCDMVLHGIETTLDGDPHRSFRHCEYSTFSKRSGFVLTEKGSELATKISRSVSSPSNSDGYAVDAAENQIPCWDDDKQELRLGDQLVKQFKLPAANQIGILRAFQEEDWPSRIDDPLPPKPGRDPKRRLHDTINALNGKQKRSLIRFYGDGSGTGVCWKLNH